MKLEPTVQQLRRKLEHQGKIGPPVEDFDNSPKLHNVTFDVGKTDRKETAHSHETCVYVYEETHHSNVSEDRH